MTKGIEITDWDLDLTKSECIRLHIWDFGGQEILHATHQFFFSQRALYLLVMTGEYGNEDAEAEYWMTLIGAIATTECPVLVILNKSRLFPFTINQSELAKKYPIRGFVSTDCEGGDGLEVLKQMICRELDFLPGLRDQCPPHWFSIKERLTAMPVDYITFDRFREICADEGEDDFVAQDNLAKYLHLLGVALNYRDDARLQDTHILNPQWITQAIYAILNSSTLSIQEGRICVTDLSTILDASRYPREKHPFILELMRKFELCVQFPESDGEYLIPQLLNKEEPNVADGFNSTNSLLFEFQYPSILPEGLIPRFIVRTFSMSRDTSRWRSGVILDFEGNSALVKGNFIERRVEVAVKGLVSGRRRLLAIIRNDFERIHKVYKFRPVEMVPIPEQPSVKISYAKLMVLERNGIVKYQDVFEDRLLEVDVKGLLDGVDLEGTRPTVSGTAFSRKALRAFISYSHQDEGLKDELETHLKLLRRRGLLDVWHDRRITAGVEWIGEIDRNLETADLALMLVSADFLASDYCYDKEMSRAMELHKSGNLRVMPIIVRDCSWNASPLGQLQALPTDGKAVTTWGRDRFSRDIAWKSVAEAIEQVILERRS